MQPNLPRTWVFPTALPDDSEALKALLETLSTLYVELFNEFEYLDAKMSRYDSGAMSGNETFTSETGHYVVRDANGADRTLSPSGDFRDGDSVEVINTAAAAFKITFDPSGLNQDILQNERGIFVYGDAAWKKIFTG